MDVQAAVCGTAIIRIHACLGLPETWMCGLSHARQFQQKHFIHAVLFRLKCTPAHVINSFFLGFKRACFNKMHARSWH
jgi:hypothetical protein